MFNISSLAMFIQTNVNGSML